MFINKKIHSNNLREVIKIGDDEPPNCEVHPEQVMFKHWTSAYCPQCKSWHAVD
jgi:hypothetical protein